MSQPATASNRKASAGSTLSDSKLIMKKQNQMTEKVVSLKGTDTLDAVLAREEPETSSKGSNSSAPKEGSDRLINRNLSLSKNRFDRDFGVLLPELK